MIHYRAASLLVVFAASAASYSVTLTGSNLWWETFGAGTRTSQNISGGYWDTGDTSGTVGMNFSSYHTTRMDREGGTASTSMNVFVSFLTGDIPVAISNLRIRQEGKLVNSGGNVENPSSITGTAGAIFEYADNGNGFYDVGEFVAYAPPIVLNYYHTGQNGNGVAPIGVGDSNSSVYVLAPNTAYTLYFVTVDQISADPAFGDPTISVTLENFNASLEFDYAAVPEPGTMVALGAGVLAALRRRRNR